MPDTTPLSNSRILAEFRERTSASAAAAARAGEVFPSGITHDSRKLSPYSLYVRNAKGSRKWDIDGNEYVDYYGGHGALMLGHGHPAVLEAVHAQLDRGTHFGASHEAEIVWGELVKRMIPSAERVRFTSSGTEANLMAIRLARAFTGRSKILRFLGHFHGWQDHVAFGVSNHFDGTPTPGVLPGIAENILLAPPEDLAQTKAIFEAHDDIAAVILEPTGASFGQIPIDPDFVAGLRALTAQHGALLIFDEVVTGFRVSKGGAQAVYGIKPDMTSLAKILAGGLPGGAVCGRADILEWLDFEKSEAKGREKIGHQGTFNANPISAAAGVAALGLIESGDFVDRACETAAAIRDGLNRLFEEERVPWASYGTYSAFHVFTNPDGRDLTPTSFDPADYDYATFKNAGKHPAVNKLRLALLNNGVDVNGKPAGIVSGIHDERDVEFTLEAWRKSVRQLREEGDIR